MGTILKSETNNGWVLKVGDPAGIAYIEIGGLTHHLNTPYLIIRYVPRGAAAKVFAGYQIDGWLVSGHLKPVTTPQLLAILHKLGFCNLSANKLRSLITQELDSHPFPK